VADVAIMVGVTLFLAAEWKASRRNRR
jgi:hypothetical protein